MDLSAWLIPHPSIQTRNEKTKKEKKRRQKVKLWRNLESLGSRERGKSNSLLTSAKQRQNRFVKQKKYNVSICVHSGESVNSLFPPATVDRNKLFEKRRVLVGV